MERLSGADDLGIEPAAAALAQDLHGLAGVALEGEDVKVLGDGHDAGERGDGSADGAVGVAAAVGLLGHADFADDGCAAVATELNHFAVVGVLGEGDAEDMGNFAEGAAVGQHLVPEETDGGEAGFMGLGPVLEFYAGLDGAIVAAADDLAHARGVGAAADVFEQQGVIKVGEGEIGEAEFAAEPHAEKESAEMISGSEGAVLGAGASRDGAVAK